MDTKMQPPQKEEARTDPPGFLDGDFLLGDGQATTVDDLKAVEAVESREATVRTGRKR